MIYPKKPKSEARDDNPNIEKERRDNDRDRHEKVHLKHEQKEQEKEHPQNGNW